MLFSELTEFSRYVCFKVCYARNNFSFFYNILVCSSEDFRFSWKDLKVGPDSLMGLGMQVSYADIRMYVCTYACMHVRMCAVYTCIILTCRHMLQVYVMLTVIILRVIAIDL